MWTVVTGLLKGQVIKKQNRFLPSLNYFAALLLSLAPAFCAEVQTASSDSTARSGATARDLTDLSLEELYNLDVIQLNVIGGHTHPAGQKMLGYEFMYMDMDGHLNGTDDVSVSQILKKFPAASTGMTVAVHMIEAMYAPTSELTLMAMLPIKDIDMDMIMDGDRFTEHSSGVGDLQLMTLYTFLGSVSKGHRLILDAGISFPTGSIDEKNTIFGETFTLEYPMQLGSGTVDLMPGLT
ncbi:MAG: transporter, partial [Verrucomicrobiota bacterium]|nr:transporter [Verrucomicrobiota bacterium]